MSGYRPPGPKPTVAAPSLEDLAALADARPLAYASELLADIWDSDEELDAFLVDVRRSRDTSAV